MIWIDLHVAKLSNHLGLCLLMQLDDAAHTCIVGQLISMQVELTSVFFFFFYLKPLSV